MGGRCGVAVSPAVDLAAASNATERYMRRPLSTLRFLAGLLAPGGVLVLTACAIQSEEVVQLAAAPYASTFCVGALAAAGLLSWYYDQSRLLCSASAVALTVVALRHAGSTSNVVQLAAVMLLPLNFSLFAVLKERGVMTLDGLLKVAIVAAQAASVFLIAERNDFASVNTNAVPWLVPISFAIGAVTLLTLVFSRRTKVEQGLFWALVAMFLSINHPVGGPFVYAGVAGLVLVFAVLEHGYDIAYRDELTGLPGRRAFNNMMGQLGGRYALAMCDVDHFKRFNDTYGHDAGDQVLRMVAAKLSHVGGGGRAFRYGGEEFLVVFRGCSASEAEPFVESLRRSIAGAGFVIRGSDRPARKPRTSETKPTNATKTNISISIGIAERSKRHSTPELVLDAADAALYRAKEAGRNCLKVDESTASVGIRVG
jgi:diguanylate cyclase (GGDEF)-like protein